MIKKIIYFGYGANSSSEMIQAIIRRRPKGFPARLKNYSLYLQEWNKLSKEVKEELGKHWDFRFKTYIAVPSSLGICYGTGWFITPKERKMISKWEFWYKPVKVKIENEKGKIFNAETEIILKKSKDKITKKNYKKFPNNKKKMLELAKKVASKNN